MIADMSSEELSKMEKVDAKFKDMCRSSKGKDNTLCYYVGGLETSATYIVNELTRPLSWGMPAEKVCEKLKRVIDLKTLNFAKAKVKELKIILEGWGESCKGCVEKSDFIRLIKERMPAHDPEAYRQLFATEL
ncbi:unnamed protein product [Protopolystoma xenopodis]|uniref:Mesencephalic astrocyte-derived neurotrophic factor homolog n=1 Tax=Protopolystoma xenopodis TaxID=117903 RepID=A0A3S5APN8_9PLAT|nr:unnamed protein product [Protopolystoma xenopodis]